MGSMRFQGKQILNLPESKNDSKSIFTLDNLFENASSEICAHENVGLLAYSPMGFGVLW
jgi:aryl-alcohol dehydrogenase-like predicted oxidoreductase